ncbi:alpha/beta hydrolase [Paludibacter sp.]|uniref:alpha/beta fold hydrolase n=1 Tax=Paludibacter sp. TaxID=1898105 RepID=UPI0013536240|nr:alpha/beta hydrolase [Paludibacter sp.]MTK53963.1 alpha/beta hydrolase [Paludibacter sp.]
MQARHYTQNKNTRLAYYDNGKDATPILFLHGHFSCASTFKHIAKELDGYRTILIDQRGHGWSDHSDDYSREAYIDDVRAIAEALHLKDIIIVGHSLGGVNAYQFASRYPQYVKALIIEDIGTIVNGDMRSFLLWPRRFDSIRSLKLHFRKNKMGDNTYFMESITEFEDGWGFRFDYEDIVRSQQQLNGNHTHDWDKVTCPTLLMHGEKSWAFQSDNATAMCEGKPNVHFIEYPGCGHVIHDEHPQQYVDDIKTFLESL